MDVPCVGCGTNLHGRLAFDACAVCGHAVALSIRDDIAASLGIVVEQISFIRAAVRDEALRRRNHNERKGPVRHLNAREACIAVRDRAVNLSGSPQNGKKMLFDLGIMGSDPIGKVIWAMVDRGMYEATEDDRREQFHGLFTLDALMTVPAVKPTEAAG